MNPFGSYRALLGHSFSAMAAAIEIYNKPRIEYRDECTVILLVNAWELLLKATLSKSRVRIYYRKRRHEPHRTFSLSDSLKKAERLFPASVDYHATARNLELLADYRDNAVHFYNEPGFGVLIYALAQTAITNFRDFARAVFGRDLGDEVTLALLPLALGSPVDPIAFVTTSLAGTKTSPSVHAFTARLKQLVVELEGAGRDTGRLFTVFRTALVSTKKIATADLIVGVQGTAGGGSPFLVQNAVDPNRSHPYRESAIITGKKSPGLGLVLHGTPLTQFPFRALVFHMKARQDTKYCWADESGAVVRYSESFLERIRRTSADELSAALKAYRAHGKKAGRRKGV